MDPDFLVHEDDTLVVVDKPPGLPSVPGRTTELADCAAHRVQQRHPDARIVHRLDMDTSGLLLMARGVAAERALHRQFERRTVAKTYVAVVHGTLPADEGSIDLPLRADWPNRPRQIVDHASGKSSLTHWRVAAREGNRTRLELSPVTGRSHQLRVHLLAIGHPIIGDRLYAPDHVAGAAARMLLHASALDIDHPVTGQRIGWRSRPPF